MARDLFEEIRRPAVRANRSTRGTLGLSLLVHALLIGAIVIVPLVAPDVLPAPAQGALTAFLVAAPPPPPPPPPAPAPARAESRLVPDQAVPTAAPDRIVPETPRPARYRLDPGVVGGVDDGLVGGIGTGRVPAPPPPPPPPPPRDPVPIGGDIRAPSRVHHATPVYPPIARQAGVQGLVILQAVIDTDGRVTDVRVLRSLPLLDQAAIDAVRQWRYTPTLLNGVPVPVSMTVTVRFVLGG